MRTPTRNGRMTKPAKPVKCPVHRCGIVLGEGGLYCPECSRAVQMVMPTLKLRSMPKIDNIEVEALKLAARNLVHKLACDLSGEQANDVELLADDACIVAELYRTIFAIEQERAKKAA